jgi:hypothetical protein
LTRKSLKRKSQYSLLSSWFLEEPSSHSGKKNVFCFPSSYHVCIHIHIIYIFIYKKKYMYIHT